MSPCRVYWLCFACIMIASSSKHAEADMFRWDNGELIPGTEGLIVSPGVQLSDRELEYADFNNLNLSGAAFQDSNLRHALFGYAFHFPDGSSLNDVSFEKSDLTAAQLGNARLTNADFNGAIVTGAEFGGSRLSREQLYSTASYTNRELQGIGLTRINASGWDFNGQNLSDAVFSEDFFPGRLSNTKFREANLSGVRFGCAVSCRVDLMGADFFGANLGMAGLQFAELVSANLVNANLSAQISRVRISRAPI